VSSRRYAPTERRWRLVLTAAFAVALWRQGDRHGATVPLWWLGQSCWNVSVYIQDARAQELPLVGGGEHDWAVILGELGLLQRDQAIGGAVYLAGVGIYAAAVIAGWRILAAAAAPSARAAEQRMGGAR
jgi:hypothetical protein